MGAAIKPVASKVARLVFDKERKLKAEHKHMRRVADEASRDAGRQRTLFDLMQDPLGGSAYVLKALLAPTWIDKSRPLTVDVASELIDDYRRKGGEIAALMNAMGELVADYLGIELTPTDDEGDPEGNAATPE